jgi:hypothetical protein
VHNEAQVETACWAEKADVVTLGLGAAVYLQPQACLVFFLLPKEHWDWPIRTHVLLKCAQRRVYGLQADAGTGKTDHIGKAVGLLNRLVARTCTDPYVDVWPIARVMPWCVDCGAHLCGFCEVTGARRLVVSLCVVYGMQPG